MRTLITLAIGAAGGALFAWAKMPLAWMLGAMCATTAVALAGARIGVDLRLRALMVTILGVMLGSTFSPAMIDYVGGWAVAVAVLFAYMPAVTAICYAFFRRVGRFDRTTAYFSAAPGGLNEMIVVGSAMGGDAAAIALVHAIRVLIAVLTIPFYFRLVEHVNVPSLMPGATFAALTPRDAALLAATAIVGWAAARLLRVPAAGLVGPMVASAAVHLAGLTASKPPAELVAAAQVVIGAAVGGRFAGYALRKVAGIMAMGVVTALIMLALTVLFTFVFADAAGFSPSGMVLALAPGGLAEMSLMALALGVDTAFVATMHILRIGAVVIIGPAFYRIWRHLKPPPTLPPKS